MILLKMKVYLMIKGITCPEIYPSNINSEYRQWNLTELHEEIKIHKQFKEEEGREM